MKFIVGRYGIQVKKELEYQKNFISVFDPFVKSADYNSIHEIPIDKYEIVKFAPLINQKKNNKFLYRK